LVCEPNSTCVPDSACEPSLVYIPFSLPKFYVSDPILVSSSNDDNEDENPPMSAHLRPAEPIENELASTLMLPRWVHSTHEEADDLVGDPRDQ